eukprot:TRINITY_DN7397_c0_g2_i2.p1 TRINITY_DN7397_c0_g2~~TRINITY_DN7397_c0_g2_i2.p1  ORF type:complete len:119 (+),score=32.54 TRINITY_DN7397_c0_g2_i2:29-385(+)
MSEAQFKKAVWLIRNGPPVGDSSNETKLKYYKFYKQATEGDNTAAAPWSVQVSLCNPTTKLPALNCSRCLQFEAKAKWDAWTSAKGMSKEDAMKAYVDLLAADDANWESHPKLAEYSE